MGKAIKHFITSGVFDGLSGTTYDGKVVTSGPEEKSNWKIAGNKCLAGCTPGQIKWDQNYAWTFWYMRTTTLTTMPTARCFPCSPCVPNQELVDATTAVGGVVILSL